MKQKIIGNFEEVTFPEFDNLSVIAKVDTGAYRGALHVDKVWQEKDKVIALVNDRQYVFNASKITNVKSSNGHKTKRFVVKTEVILRNKKYDIWIGITNRHKMKFKALLGRLFLQENNLIVDVNINKEYNTDGRKSK